MTPIQILYNSKSWKDFERRISKLPKDRRGIAFEWLCVFYLQIEPRYKTTYKRVLHSSEYLKDRKIKKILGFKKKKEEGVDAIAERFDGKYDIIQSKYLDNINRNLVKGHIASSLEVATGKNARNWVDTILMCSNVKGITRNPDLRERHPEIQFRTLMGGDFKLLTSEDFENIRRVIDDKIPKYEPKIPREHQRRAVSSIQEHFKKNNRGLIVHACGTGKTLTSYFAFRELKPKLTLFAVPSLQLIRQTLLEWTKESLANKSPISPFVVCSDKSNEKIGECEPALWLQELGIKVSNKREDLEVFLKSRRKNKVIFATYQSGEVLAKNIKALNKQIDFAFFDEAHNTATSKRKPSSHLLWDKNISIKKRLFMTATPKVFVGKNEEIASMDNEEIYGKLIDEITVKEAIEDLKLLNDYQIITQIVKDDSYTELLADNPFVVDKVKLPEEVELKLLSSAITLQKVRKEKDIKNVVSFHGAINRAIAFRKGAKQFDRELNTYFVHGKQSGTVRQNILEEFAENTPSLVTNARCLSEGVDVPSIDAIMFVDPKQSRLDITQAIGRALRGEIKGKGISYIIVPTIVDKDNPENIEEAYQQILMVLRAMAEHDGRIVEYIRLIREGKKPQRNFVEVNSEYSSEEFDLEDFTEKLHFKAWDKVAKLGRRPFEQARAWVRTQGFKGIKEWNEFSKTSKKPHDIPADPYRAYSKEWISWPDFLGNPTQAEELDRLIREYKEYANKRFDPIPPNRYKLKDGYKLGVRVRSIIGSYQRGTLPEWKKDIVNKELIKPGILHWEGRDAFAWERAYKLYKEYLDKGGDAIPKRGSIYKGVNLEAWVQNQKLKYKLREGLYRKRNVRPLSDKQFDDLKKINFQFEDTYDLQWEEMVPFTKSLLIKHKGKIPNKNLDTQKPYEHQGIDLKRWISKQRTRYKSATLEEEKIKKLESLRYWSWDPFSDAFEKNLNTLIEYIQKKGISNPPQGTKYKNINIGVFLTKLRAKEKKGNLDKEIKQRLEKLGTKFKPTREQGSYVFYD